MIKNAGHLSTSMSAEGTFTSIKDSKQSKRLTQIREGPEEEEEHVERNEQQEVDVMPEEDEGIKASSHMHARALHRELEPRHNDDSDLLDKRPRQRAMVA